MSDFARIYHVKYYREDQSQARSRCLLLSFVLASPCQMLNSLSSVAYQMLGVSEEQERSEYNVRVLLEIVLTSFTR